MTTWKIPLIDPATGKLPTNIGGGGGTTDYNLLTNKPTIPTTPAAIGAQPAGDYATNTALGLKAPIASPTFTGTVSGVTKAHVGLGNVDNTSDANKPVSTAQATAIGAKADTSALTAHTGNTANPHAVTKAQVGLGNVDNTADTAKPVSTAQQSALDLKVPIVAGYPMTFMPRVGQYSQPTGMNAAATGTIINQRASYTPFFVGPQSWTMDAFRVLVATAAVGGAGLAFDIALYKDDGTGWPNTAQQVAVAPAASVDLTATGAKTAVLTTPVVLTPGLYWAATLYQYTTVPTTAPQVSCISGCSWTLPITTGINVGTVPRGITLATQTTLPTSGTLNSALTTFSGATDCPVVAIRRSA
jgi:hypothetical protein